MLRTLADAMRSQALLGFDLPGAPPRIDELPAPLPGSEALRVEAPAGRFLIFISASGPLALAFEAALFDLLAEHRFAAPAPRRASAGGLIAQLKGPEGPAAASCYPWPPGHPLEPQLASAPQLIGIGRLLARLHQLGRDHPASIPDPCDGALLASRLPFGAQSDAVAEVLRRSHGPLPVGALHGRPGPAQFLFVGERPSALLPAGCACSGPLLLDLAEALVGWALALPQSLPALRALLAGYQSLRRLGPEERASLHAMLQHAAARADARALIAGRRAGHEAGALAALARIGEDQIAALAR